RSASARESGARACSRAVGMRQVLRPRYELCPLASELAGREVRLQLRDVLVRVAGLVRAEPARGHRAPLGMDADAVAAAGVLERLDDRGVRRLEPFREGHRVRL